MGKGSAGGLKVPLMVVPLVVVAIMLVCAGFAIYYFGKEYFLDELYGPHLTGLVAEKRQDIDGWCGSLKKDVVALAAQPAVREQAAKAAAYGQKAKGDASTGGSVMPLLRDRTSPEKHMLLMLLSSSGRAVAASHAEILREDWSGSGFMKKIKQPLQGAVITGPIVLNQLIGIVTVAPVSDKAGNQEGLLVSISSLQGFSERLRVERGLYRTEEVDLVSRDGEAILTSRGMPKTKVHYTVPWTGSQGVREHGNVVYTLAELREAPFGLIGSVVAEEFLAPLMTFLTIFAVCAGLILLALCIICLVVVPSVVIAPLKRLAGEVRAVSEGAPFDASAAPSYRGEIGTLRESIVSLVTARERATAISPENRGSFQGMRGVDSVAFTLAGNLVPAIDEGIRTRLGAIHRTASSIRAGDISATDLHRSAAVISDLSQHATLLLDLAVDLDRIRQGVAPITPSAFSLGDLFKKVEKEAGGYLAHKKISFIIDVDAATADAAISCDEDRAKSVLTTLVILLSAPITVGAITLFSSRGGGKGGDTVDVSVMAVSADSATDVHSAGTQGEALRGLYPAAAEIARHMGGVLTCRGSEANPEVCCLSLPSSPQ